MGDKSDVDVDDLVTTDELDDLRDEFDAATEPDGDGGGMDPDEIAEQVEDEIDSFAKDDAVDVADQRVNQHLDHLINEDCDTEACEHKRDGIAEMVAERLGIDADELDGAADGEADEGDADGESEPEDAETTETGGGDAHRGGEPDGDEGDAKGNDGSSDGGAESDSDDADDEDVETNVFGEPV